MESDERNETWKLMLTIELKKQLLNIQNLSIEEIDVIFSILAGGDFQGLQVGTNAITKSK